MTVARSGAKQSVAEVVRVDPSIERRQAWLVSTSDGGLRVVSAMLRAA
jgi:hypothetical protein